LPLLQENEKLYKVLGVPKTASADEIKKAYRKIALKEHPDKGGDPDKFKAAQAAYDILGDEKKRTAYDEGGEDAVPGDDDGGGGGGAADLFGAMFGGGGGGGRGRGPRRTKNKEYKLEVKLEDVYNGKTINKVVERECLCKSCGGTGGAEGVKEVSCASCRGQGVKIMMRQIGPGMVQQVSPPPSFFPTRPPHPTTPHTHLPAPCAPRPPAHHQHLSLKNTKHATPCCRCKCAATLAAARAPPSPRAKSARPAPAASSSRSAKMQRCSLPRAWPARAQR
jgi:hypothetical protein